MRLLFIVEGEGRGHISQALAVKEICAHAGYEIVSTLVSAHKDRVLPDYFSREFPNLKMIPGPELIYRRAREIDYPRTVTRNVRRAPRFLAGATSIIQAVDEVRPDLVVSFFSHLNMILQTFHTRLAPVLCIAHQNMLWHPAYIRPQGRQYKSFWLKALAWTASTRCHRLALSYFDAPGLKSRRLTVCPPILRKKVRELRPSNGEYILVYLLNHGYRRDVEQWHRRRPDVPMHCFYDRPGAPEQEVVDRNLVFHRLHGERFLQLMAGCRAVVCTGGFQVVSEAACLGKPVLMVPTGNSPEQHLNALDAEIHGLGRYRRTFNLDVALETPPPPDSIHAWLDRAEERFRTAVEAATACRRGPSAGT